MNFPPILLVAFAVAGVLLLAIFRSPFTQWKDSFTAAGKVLRLAGGGGRLEGTLDGYELKVHQPLLEGTLVANAVDVFICELDLKSAPDDLRLTDGQTMGPLSTGDADFDQALKVHAKDQVEAIEWLESPGRRAAFVDLARESSELELSERHLKITFEVATRSSRPTDKSLPHRSDELVRISRLVVGAATQIDAPEA